VPEEPSPQQRADAHAALRKRLTQIREPRRRLLEPIHHGGHSSYDPETGTIAVGEHVDDGALIRIRLHDPDTGEVPSALAIGNPGMGKSNWLRVMAGEAAMSGRFLVIPILLGRQEDADHLAFWQAIAADERLVATSPDKAIEILTLVRHIVNERLENEQTERDQISPAIMVAIDDSDVLLQQDLGARLVTDLLQRGGLAGVGLAIVVSDINSITSNADLMYELVSCENRQAYMNNGHYVLAGLAAMHGKRRTETLRDSEPVFVLHRDASRTSLGFLIASISAEASSAQAQKWCSERLMEAGVHVTEWEHPINDPECWEMFDPLRVRFYELRRHADVWAVVAVISKIGGTAMSEPADMISWADQAIEFRFSTRRSSWQRGPTTDCPSALTLYSDIKGELTAKNTDAGIFDAILRIY
jgi:hypothetical protein